MAQVINFPNKSRSIPAAQFSTSLDELLADYQWHYGRDAYWHYVKKHGKLPEASAAISLCKLLGHKVRGENLKYFHPSRKKADRKIGKKATRENLRLLLLVEQLANSIAELGKSGSSVAKELKKNNSEHIANYSEVALNWIADFHREWISADEEQVDTTPKNPRICVIK